MSNKSLTELLTDWGNGDAHALETLTPLVYRELRKIAYNYMRQERSQHTLQATALVNEAYLHLREHIGISWKSRAHFFGVAANLMRRVLVDHARSRNTSKRGGGVTRFSIDELDIEIAVPDQGLDLIELDTALEALSQHFPGPARVVELRYFGGLSIEETAETMGISSGTVKRHWTLAKAWLHRWLSGESAGHG